MRKRPQQPKYEAKKKSPLLDPNHQSIAELIFRHLQESGCETRDMIAISSKLIGLVTTEMTKLEDMAS